MKTGRDWVIELMATKNWTRYRTAKELGLTNPRLYQLIGDTDASISDDTAVRLARLLGVPEEHVLLSVRAEQARTPETKAAWERILGRCATIALGLALPYLGALFGAPGASTQAQTARSAETTMYIMSTRRGGRRWWRRRSIRSRSHQVRAASSFCPIKRRRLPARTVRL